MKEALDVVMAWQLRNPGKTDTNEAIEEVKKQGELAYSLADHFLKLTVRPLFIKTKPSNVTEQGRKKAPGQHNTSTTIIDDEIARPWKDAQNVQCLSLLRWSIQSLNEQGVERLWPLLIPPILTLLDDWDTKYKKLGAELLAQVLSVTAVDLLKRTGLGPVFEEALMPCLTYLPPLTNPQDSVQLLPAVYDALTNLAATRYPAATKTSESNLPLPAERVVSLDAVVRKGVIYGYTHASQHPAIVIMLFHNLTLLINQLGIEFVKHLKFVLPMLNEALSNPLATAQPELLRAAITAVRTIIQTCWPRMVVHRGEILRGLTLCWLNLDKQDVAQTLPLKQDLKDCIALLRNAIGDQVALDTEFDSLVSADVRLEGLLKAFT